MLDQLTTYDGTTLAFRRELARAVFEQTARYDRLIADYLDRSLGGKSAFPTGFSPSFQLRTPLRYGENPHQRAAFYVEPSPGGPNLATAAVRHGKELSYNNLLDLDSALRLVRSFAEPAAVILKHNNPCGDDCRCHGRRLGLAYGETPSAPFGGIVGTNRPVDLATAERMCVPGRFIEAVVAPASMTTITC